MNYYFTNPTQDRITARVIQEYIEKQTGLKLVNPFYGKDGEPTKEIKNLDLGLPMETSAEEIVGADLKKIADSIGIIAYITDKSSLGSPMEIFYAKAVLGKPVYTICGYEHLREHPWLKYYSSEMFNNAKQFIKWAKENLKDATHKK